MLLKCCSFERRTMHTNLQVEERAVFHPAFASSMLFNASIEGETNSHTTLNILRNFSNDSTSCYAVMIQGKMNWEPCGRSRWGHNLTAGTEETHEDLSHEDRCPCQLQRRHCLGQFAWFSSKGQLSQLLNSG
jgi:hypothetical protein